MLWACCRLNCHGSDAVGRWPPMIFAGSFSKAVEKRYSVFGHAHTVAEKARSPSARGAGAQLCPVARHSTCS